MSLNHCNTFHIFNLFLQLKKTQLTEKEMTQLTDLCLFWDLPVPSLRNRDWLFQQLLSHAVSFAVLFYNYIVTRVIEKDSVSI